MMTWLSKREDEPRTCSYGSHPYESSEPRCDVVITLRGSTVAGHRGFCSDRHAALAQVDEAV